MCPSCSSKSGIIFAECLQEQVLLNIPNRHVVFTIPKRLRAYFRYDRNLNRLLFAAAWNSIKELYGNAVRGVPGCVLSLETAGELLNFHPHLHSIVSDGVINENGEFVQLKLNASKLCKLFEHKLLSALKSEAIISETVIAQMQSWQTSGFSVWIGDEIDPDDSEARWTKLALNSFKLIYDLLLIGCCHSAEALDPSCNLVENVQRHARNQAENLKQLDFVQSAIASGQTSIHSWVLDIGSYSISAYDSDKAQWRDLSAQ